MSRIEKAAKFFSQWVIPGSNPVVYPIVETTASQGSSGIPYDLLPEDEALLGDVAKDTFPQEVLDVLTSNVNQLLERILPDEKTESISITPTRDWRTFMPQNAEGSHFSGEGHPIVSISREGEEKRIKTILEFDFSDENHTGKFAFEYQDGECTLASLHSNQYDETIKERDKVRTPLAHAVRMSLFHEALGFFQNERDLRRDLRFTEYKPFQSNTVDGQ